MNTLPATKDSTAVEFVPHGGNDPIKLSLSIVQKLVAVPTRSGKICSDRDALKFIAMCRARRLNPFEGDAFLIGYDGKSGPEFSLITAHQAFLKRAELHPEYDGMQSGVVVQQPDGELLDREGDFHLAEEVIVGGWARVHFKTRKHPTYRHIRLERFNKGFAQWQVDPAGMICKCAEADALRSSFPTMLGGLYMREEGAAPSNNGAFDVAADKLPAVALIPQSEAWPDEKAHEEQKQPGKSPQEELAEIIVAAGFTFDDLAKWGVGSGNLPEAESYTGFDEITVKDARRLLRAQAGLLQGLAAGKAGAR